MWLSVLTVCSSSVAAQLRFVVGIHAIAKRKKAEKAAGGEGAQDERGLVWRNETS